jgi:hypothetical protein
MTSKHPRQARKTFRGSLSDLLIMIELGVRPVFVHGFADDPTWTRNFAQAMERVGVESLWACEHIVLANHYEPRYP